MKILSSVFACTFALSLSAAVPKVIFDTDMLTDFDDVGALACLHAMADAGECEILATVSCTRGNASVGAVEVINHYYGRGDLPVGCAKEIGVIGDKGCRNGRKSTAEEIEKCIKSGGDGGHYKYRKLLKDYPGWFKYADSDDAPDANIVYRKALASAPDNSVVICSVGFLTNLRRLLETKGDDISPLDGRALVAKKVKRWVAMALKYPKGREYNSMMDPESSKIALETWPTEVVISDWEFGFDTFAGRRIAEMPGPRNPVKDVFAGNIPPRAEISKDPAKWLRNCFGMGGRSAWDETAVIAAVRGVDRYSNVERGTYRMIGNDGEDEWAPSVDGRHLRLVPRITKAQFGEVIDELICRAPKGKLSPENKLRYMTFNIWGDYFKNPVPEREGGVGDVILRHSPDLLSLQEVTPSWWASPMFPRLEKAGYCIIRGDEKTALIAAGAPADTSKWRRNWVNHEPLLYRKDRFDLLDSGVEFFHFILQAEKSFTWAVLRDRRTGSRFISFATHFWYKNTQESDAIRELNARAIFARMEALRAKWGDLPVIGGGDLNSEPDSYAHRAFALNGYVNAADVADVRDPIPTEHGDPVRDEKGVYHGKAGIGKDNPKGSCWIDHVFFSRDRIHAFTHKVIVDQDALDTSDHSPVVVDFSL